MPRIYRQRPDWDEYFLNFAEAASQRADCTRRSVGAVIVKDNRIVATGYNGAPPGEGSCLAGDCPRGKHYTVDVPFYVTVNCDGDTTPLSAHQECACGSEEWPCRESVEPGSSYDTGAGSCIAVHAELNALLYADRDKCEGATMYIAAVTYQVRDGQVRDVQRTSGAPCDGCMRAIKGAGIARAVWTLDMDSTDSWSR